MYIFDIENKAILKDVLLDNLKILGVRCRLPKKIKENEKENVYSDSQIFQKPLHLLKKCVTQRIDGSTLEVPEFLADACSVIEKDVRVEGIFRKAGSTCKQRERKLELNQGKKVSCEYHVFDACSLVKLFFRELPQPIFPFGYHEIFLKCLLLPTYEKEVDALLLACMLLPEENLATLAFFMEFLLKVSQHAEKNKMNVKNLAIILTPTLMPVNKGTRVSNSLEMASHFKVIEMLIENAVRIGKVPGHIIENLILISNKKQKKKRRSGSITRMFTGLKKIVSSRGSEWDDSIISTPDSLSSLRKRKNTDTSSKISLSAKKKRLTDSSLATMTPLQCRMQGYVTAMHLVPSPVPTVTKRNCVKSPVDKSVNDRGSSEMRDSRLNIVRRCTTKRQKTKKKLASTTDLENLPAFETDRLSLERKLSLVSWGHKATSLTDLLSARKEVHSHEESSEKSVDLSDSEFITVPKSEYEDIKNRVSALEEDLEKLATVHSVQNAFERTLEESEKLSNDHSSDQLARRLSRELNIRRSCETKIVRSPSARKIGSIRRRSRETTQRNSEPRSNLKRGRPNTLQTGLPSPRLRTLSNENISSAKKKNPIARSATFREGKEEWKSGEIFFSKENLLQRLAPTPQGRPSVAEIRSHNAGMVLEKAKLFNSLNESNGAGRKLPRRQSVRLENLRRMNDGIAVTRARSFGSERKPKISPVLTHERGGGVSARVSEGFKDAFTPKSQRSHISRRDTPSIKKPLVTRSPRSFAKTPVSQMRSSQRSRATPMKALIEAGATPHIGLRRSPRILARAINTPSRLRD